MIICKNCKFFKSQKENPQQKFVEVNSQSTNFVIVKKIKMCQHFICFKYSQKDDVAYGPYEIKERIQGQAQLNKDYKCKYFKKLWWKFWEKCNMISQEKKFNI